MEKVDGAEKAEEICWEGIEVFTEENQSFGESIGCWRGYTKSIMDEKDEAEKEEKWGDEKGTDEEEGVREPFEDAFFFFFWLYFAVVDG